MSAVPFVGQRSAQAGFLALIDFLVCFLSTRRMGWGSNPICLFAAKLVVVDVESLDLNALPSFEHMNRNSARQC